MKEHLEFDKTTNQEDEKQANYMALGMCFGAMAGSVGMCILATFGQIVWGSLCIAVGLTIGMLVGMAIPKKK